MDILFKPRVEAAEQKAQNCMDISQSKNQRERKITSKQTCQLSRFSRESPSFSSNLPVSRLEQQISRKLSTVALFLFFFFFFFFTNFIIIFEISKRKIKQEGNLLHLFSERIQTLSKITMQIFLAVSGFLYSSLGVSRYVQVTCTITVCSSYVLDSYWGRQQYVIYCS